MIRFQHWCRICKVPVKHDRYPPLPAIIFSHKLKHIQNLLFKYLLKHKIDEM